MRGYTSLLTRVLGRFDCPVWAVEADDVDEMLHALAVAGLAAGTRRQYLQMLRAFHAFVVERYAVQVRPSSGSRWGRVGWTSTTGCGMPVTTLRSVLLPAGRGWRRSSPSSARRWPSPATTRPRPGTTPCCARHDGAGLP
ncbi:hypothetical protein ACWCYZ_46830 [Streptomyces virginiae]